MVILYTFAFLYHGFKRNISHNNEFELLLETKIYLCGFFLMNKSFLLQKRGGISRYFTELIRTFMQTPTLKVEPVLNFKSTANETLLSLSQELDLGITRISSAKPLQIVQSIATNTLRFPNVDLLHHTFY